MTGQPVERDVAAAVVDAADVELAARWTQITRGVDAVQQNLATALDRVGLTLPYFMVLSVLFAAEDHRLPMSRIARDLAMTSGGFTKLADRMARDGLIDRRGSAGDRRVVFAALTEAGRVQAQGAVLAYHGFLRDHVLRSISPQEMQTMASISSRLLRGADDPGVDSGAFAISQRTTDEPDRRST